jgi:AraC family transcriptional regulator
MISAPESTKHRQIESGQTLPDIRMTRYLLTLLETAQAGLVGDRDQARSSLTAAVDLLRTTLPDVTRRGGLAPWQIARLRTFIDANLHATLRVQVLSRCVGLSTSYFTRAFRQSFGMAPHSYVQRRRLEQACALMRDQEAKLTDIALACGFTDQAHFCRLFKAQYGETPALWRRHRRNAL